MSALLATAVAFWRVALRVLLINAWMAWLQPWVPDHLALAAKEARVELETGVHATFLTATVQDESSLGLHRVGDGHRSFGIGQIFGRPDLENDDLANLFEVARQIRISFAMSAECPFCGYLGGPNGIQSAHTRWVSNRRMKEAAALEAWSPTEGVASR